MIPAVLIVGLAAAEPTVAERLARGRASFDALDFDEAALELGFAARDPRATEDELLEANLWAGAAHVVLGNDTVARLHFLHVLRRRPDYAVPESFAPKIKNFVALVRDEVVAPAPTADSPTVAGPGSSPLPALTTAVGGAFLLVGGGSVLVGSGPFFAHEAARKSLLEAAATNADGTDAADRQASARAAWGSWGAPLVIAGVISLGVGAVAAALGGVWWAGSP